MKFDFTHRKETCLVFFCGHSQLRDALKSECSVKNLKERGREFTFKELFLKISVRLFASGGSFEIKKAVSYYFFPSI